ncbi:hypothetical protein [Peterkaempfera griseoplana]|uniref:hypothetical protein n=1 Tax=Peterkaempfera griseoplana TaxID=66896 RepID=UPI0006E3D401|nr:hypothetical protein [Peterkaempfera griseoplana]
MSTETRKPGDALVRAGAVVFAVGAVATVATFIPLFLDLTRLPTAAYWLSMLMPAGFLVALLGLLRAARAQRHHTAG